MVKCGTLQFGNCEARLSKNPIYVARPMVPEIDDFISVLSPALQNRRLTNGGPISAELELRLSEVFRVPHVNLTTNGTIAIEIAAKAVGFSNKVITTPFTFAATVGALIWMGLDPILVDIDEDYLTIDPESVANAIDDSVGGILGVHVYGCPCDVDALGEIARTARIPIVYDGAHVFDATYKGKSIVSYGDATTMSFHATKQFNTGEGGAIVTASAEINSRINNIKNFGIESEDMISDIGTNGKMSEINAAFGIANLNVLFEEKARRAAVSSIYTSELSGHKDIRLVPQRLTTKASTNYYAIRLPVQNGEPLRNKVYLELREQGIYTRKYFYPLLSDVQSYRKHMSQKEFDIPNAMRAAQEVLALPLHGGVSDENALMICDAIKKAIA